MHSFGNKSAWRTIPFAFLAFAPGFFAGGCSDTPQRASSEEVVGCAALPAELEAERAAWVAMPVALRAAADATAPRAVVTLVKTRLSLLPAADLKPAALSKQEANPKGSFGGIVAFAPGRGGMFRVSTSERAWLDVIDRAGARPLTPLSSDKRLRCFGVAKALVFELEPGADYLLQVTAASARELDLMIAQAAR